MKKIPVYVNPYEKVHFGPSTVMTLHRFGIFDPDVARAARDFRQDAPGIALRIAGPPAETDS
jgi:hypothetical protein